MKNLFKIALCVCITLNSFTSSGQSTTIPINEPDNNKPLLFSNLPDKIPVSIDEINTMFSSPVGREVSLKLSAQNNLQFAGDVVSTINKYANSMQSVVVRSNNFNGASLSVTKIIAVDGKVSYVGRIISFKHGDVYELQSQNNELVLVKRKFNDLVNE